MTGSLTDESMGARMYAKALKAMPKVFMKQGGDPSECMCNGKQNDKGQGGDCQSHGFRTNWCYVNDACRDKAAVTAPELPGNKRLFACESDMPARNPHSDYVAAAKEAAQLVKL